MSAHFNEHSRKIRAALYRDKQRGRLRRQNVGTRRQPILVRCRRSIRGGDNAATALQRQRAPIIDKTWFFDAEGKLTAWIRARRLGDAADGRAPDRDATTFGSQSGNSVLPLTKDRGAGKQCLPGFPLPTHSGWILLFNRVFSDATNPQGLRFFPRGSLDQGENQGVK